MIRLDERNIFLLDGIGAALSALFTGVVLPQLVLPRVDLGLPATLCYGLAAFPVVYFVFSISCWRAKTIRPWMLLGVIAANSLYAVVSGLVLLLAPDITGWGRVLLIGELAVLALVIAIETHVYRRAF